MTNLKAVEKIAEKFDNDLIKIELEIKRIQSAKCRLKKFKGKSSYANEMTEILKYEQVLKEAKSLIEPKKKTVPSFNQDDINILDYDETIKALKSIQSKKTLTKYLTEEVGKHPDYIKACEVEKMLLEHKSKIQPVSTEQVRKTEVSSIIDVLESSGQLSQEQIIELLKKLM